MFNDISPLISSQVPEHLRADSPLFTSFLETYYEYASQRDKAVGIVQNFAIDTDIDYCDEQYISRFYEVYGRHIPTQMVYDRRNFIKLLNAIYNAKGTEKALRLIFQAVFGETVEVSYPSEQILKASDGVWIREKFFTVKTEYGAIPNGDSVFFSFSNVNGDYNFESSKIEVLPDGYNRIHFRSFYKLTFVDNQVIYHYDTYGTLVYIGKLVYSPAKIIISNPGKDWIKGQAISIPGTIKNTVAKVLSTNNDGGITALEIIEYGYNHGSGQLASVTPYQTKPITPTYNLTSTMVTFSPLSFHHTLTIHDYVDSVDEVITRTHTSPFTDGSVNTTTNVVNVPRDNADTTGFTLEEWYDSRASFIVEFEQTVTTKGYYENSRGQLSNQNVKMQDNYYYQAYSYLMETARDVREYIDLLNITHPAGLKRFSRLTKATDFLLTVDVSRTMSVDTVYLLSVYTATDTLFRAIDKVLTDNVTLPEYIAKTLITTRSDLVALNELYANHLTKNIAESIVGINDSEIFDILKVLLDIISTSDSDIFNFSKILSDSVVMTDILSKQSNKYFTDTVTVEHLVTTSTILDVTYTAEEYFAEKYTPYSYTLIIG